MVNDLILLGFFSFQGGNLFCENIYGCTRKVIFNTADALLANFCGAWQRVLST
ncbi:hypothetical protein C4J97_3499 [Pseudomonas orientalis]|nr:hypothetical protein C4J97_3499 [Pseudomonas orientalis]